MNKKNLIILLVILAVILVVAFILWKKENNFWPPDSSPTRTENNEESVKEFEVQAFRFGYNPDRLVVKRGEKVKLIIKNLDTLHGIRIPDLDLKGDDLLEFTAEQTGEFKWYCNNFCGSEHRQMGGTLVVE